MPSLEDIYLFRHAAYREVAYRLQLPSERSSLHAGTLDIIERLFPEEVEPLAAELAEHARLARENSSGAERDALAEKEAGYLKQALSRALERTQWETVISLAKHALECPGVTDEYRLRARYELAHALELIGRPDDATREYERLVESAREADSYIHEFQGLTGRALIFSYGGKHDESNALLDEAIALARKHDDADRLAKALMDKSLDASARGDYAEVESFLHQAEAAIDGIESASIRPMIRGNLANHLGATGRRDESVAILRELVREFEAAENVRYVGVSAANLGRQSLLLNDFENADADLQRAIECCAEVGNKRTEAFALANLAELEMRLGRFDAAGEHIRRATEISQDIGLPAYHAAYLINEAQLELLLGHHERAAQIVEDSRAEFVGIGSEVFVPEYCGIMRLRIASSEAVSTPTPGRATSRLSAHPPHRSWLHVVRGLLREIEAAHKDRGHHTSSLLHDASERGRALLNELEAAVREDRPALIFRGHLPTEMHPDLRSALVKRMEASSPHEKVFLEKHHPELMDALRADH